MHHSQGLPGAMMIVNSKRSKLIVRLPARKLQPDRMDALAVRDDVRDEAPA
jgi:hypothetical protein